MRRLLVTMVLLSSVGSLVLAGDKTELEKLAGTWVIVSVEQGGNATPAETVKQLNARLVMKGDKYETLIGDKPNDKGSLTVDVTKAPKTFDIKPAEGPLKGKTILAIYELNGDELKACYNIDGSERPKEFKTKAGSQLILLTYKRQK